MTALTTGDILLRLLVAAVAGGIIGWERETHGRPAGLRTSILACVAWALAMIISEMLFSRSTVVTAIGAWRPDPARLAAGVLTGIGFLGAGTILRNPHTIRGVTTAASLWFVTMLGLAFGAGLFGPGLLALLLALCTLFVLPLFERHIRPDYYATIRVVASIEKPGETEITSRIEGLGALVKGTELELDSGTQQKTFACEVRCKKDVAIELCSRIVREVSAMPGVLRVS